MIEDILYEPLFFVFETPNEGSGGTILALSYDGNNFEFTTGESSVENVTVFIN